REQGRQEGADAARRRLPGHNPGFLGEPRHGRLGSLLQARGLLLRRQGPARADQLRLARRLLVPLPRGQRPEHGEEDMSLMTESEAKTVTQKVLSFASAPATTVTLQPTRAANTPFSRTA